MRWNPWITIVFIFFYVNLSSSSRTLNHSFNNCSEFILKNVNSSCVCQVSQGVLTIENCTAPLILGLPTSESWEIFTWTSIVLRNMGRLVVLKGFLEPKLSEVQHISIENISTVVFRREAFTQIIVNVMINQVNNIVMEERSFSSCWGSVWIVNHGTHKNINGNAMSSSDMMLWQDDQFKSHPRPESTPFQKFQGAIELADRMDRLEAEMYGLLVVSGLTILCLIGLTIVASRNHNNDKNQFAASMDVEMRPPLPAKKIKRKKSNPVTRLSKIQVNKRNNGSSRDLKNGQDVREESSMRQYLPRPPALPLPR